MFVQWRVSSTEAEPDSGGVISYGMIPSMFNASVVAVTSRFGFMKR